MSNSNGSTTIQGVLAAFSFGCVSGSKRDPVITHEVCQEKGANEDAGSWSNKLFPPLTCGKKNTFTELRKHLGMIRGYHYNSTFQFEDQLWRILPEKRIETYKRVVEQEGKQQAKELLDKFVEDLPALIDLARLGRGEAFKLSDYPSAEEARSKFFYSVSYRPIPSAAGLNPALMQDAIDQLNLLHQQRLAESNTALLQRMLEPFQTLTEQLKDPTKRKIGSVLETILQVANDIPSLDLTNNTELHTLAQQVKDTFEQIKPEMVREDAEMRQRLSTLCTSAISNLERFGTYGVRKLNLG